MRSTRRSSLRSTAATLTAAALLAAGTVAADRQELPTVGLVGVQSLDGTLTTIAANAGGLLWLGHHTHVEALDVTAPMAPELVWTTEHDGRRLLPGEDVQGQDGNVVLQVIRDTDGPRYNGYVPVDCRDCDVLLMDTTSGVPALVSTASRAGGHNVICLDDCTTSWLSRRTLRFERPSGTRSTISDDIPFFHHGIQVAPDRVVTANSGYQDLWDTTNQDKPVLLGTWEGADNTTANHVAVGHGTTEAFVSESEVFVIRTDTGDRCGVRWLDWGQLLEPNRGRELPHQAAQRWVPTPSRSMTSTFPDQCITKADAHPDFATNRLVAVAAGMRGVIVAHVSDAGDFTEVLHLDGSVLGRAGTAVDITWTSPTTLAVALYEGGAAAVELDLGGA